MTRRVGLQDRVRVLEGNVRLVPLASDRVDVVVSQEALLHVPDKRRVLAE
ncbi:methyltransferase domain-containing protein, partial [Pseudomonas aeruginosa]